MTSKAEAAFIEIAPQKMLDPFDLPETSFIKKQMRKLNKYAFKLKLTKKLDQNGYQYEPSK